MQGHQTGCKATILDARPPNWMQGTQTGCKPTIPNAQNRNQSFDSAYIIQNTSNQLGETDIFMCDSSESLQLLPEAFIAQQITDWHPLHSHWFA